MASLRAGFSICQNALFSGAAKSKVSVSHKLLTGVNRDRTDMTKRSIPAVIIHGMRGFSQSLNPTKRSSHVVFFFTSLYTFNFSLWPLISKNIRNLFKDVFKAFYQPPEAPVPLVIMSEFCSLFQLPETPWPWVIMSESSVKALAISPTVSAISSRSFTS